MKHILHQVNRGSRVAQALVSAALTLMAGVAQAQTIYRVVGADGKVSFSDKPPVSAAQVTATDTGSKAPAVDGNGPALPFALRQVVGKYPVTLYTANNCTPCGSGRAMLSRRGVPFTEKTITTPEDAEALQRISGENSLPFLTIGSQQIKGYSDSEWTQFLDAAGYPKASILPAGYRHPAAAPLVVIQKTTPVAKPENTQPARTPADAGALVPPDNASNPAGIKF